MYDIQLTETLDITCQEKKKLAIDVVEVLGTRGDSAAIRGIFNLTDDEPNLFFRHGNYVVCFQTIEEYDEYTKIVTMSKTTLRSGINPCKRKPWMRRNMMTTFVKFGYP